MPNNTNAWTTTRIREKLETSDEMVKRSLLVLYDYQTTVEQNSQETVENNGVGFNGVDAPFLSSVAEWVMKGNRITPKQMVIVRKKIYKYSTQLAKIANKRLQTNLV